MGEVKRYREGGVMYESEHGGYVLRSEFARLERERDHYKTFHDETMPVLEAAQGLRNRLEATERAMSAQADELTRLRAVEKAAKTLLDTASATRSKSVYHTHATVTISSIGALAEACGRKR